MENNFVYNNAESDRFHVITFLNQKFPWTFQLPLLGAILKWKYLNLSVIENLTDWEKGYDLRQSFLILNLTSWLVSFLVTFILWILYLASALGVQKIIPANFFWVRWLIVYSPTLLHLLCYHLLWLWWKAQAKSIYEISSLKVEKNPYDEYYYMVKLYDAREWILTISRHRNERITSWFYSKNLRPIRLNPILNNHDSDIENVSLEEKGNTRHRVSHLGFFNIVASIIIVFATLWAFADYWRMLNLIWKKLLDLNEHQLARKTAQYISICALVNALWYLSNLSWFVINASGVVNDPLLNNLFVWMPYIQLFIYLIAALF